MAITDKFTKTRDGGDPIVATVTTNRSPGGTSLSCDDLNNWPNDTVHFITYKQKASGAIDYETLQAFKGIVSGNAIGTVTLQHSPTDSDLGNDIGDFVEMAPTASYGQDLYEGLTKEHSVDGDHKSELITERTAITSTASDDQVLVADASDSDKLKKVALKDLLPDGSMQASKIDLPSLQPEYFTNTNSDTISVTPTRDGVIKVTHQRVGWGFDGNTWRWTINTPSGLTKVAGTNAYVTGGNTVGREMTAFGIYTDAKAGTQYTFSLTHLQGSSGASVNNTRNFVVECYPA